MSRLALSTNLGMELIAAAEKTALHSVLKITKKVSFHRIANLAIFGAKIVRDIWKICKQTKNQFEKNSNDTFLVILKHCEERK